VIECFLPIGGGYTEGKRGGIGMQSNLENLLEKNQKAAEFYHSLHVSVRAMVDKYADEIKTQEDLVALANRGMTHVLKEYGGIYNDSSPYSS
jgi:hypothetical protein